MAKKPVEIGDTVRILIDMEIREFEVFTKTYLKGGIPAFLLVDTSTKKTMTLSQCFVHDNRVDDHDWTMEIIKMAVVFGIAVFLSKFIAYVWGM